MSTYAIGYSLQDSEDVESSLQEPTDGASSRNELRTELGRDSAKSRAILEQEGARISGRRC